MSLHNRLNSCLGINTDYENEDAEYDNDDYVDGEFYPNEVIEAEIVDADVESLERKQINDFETRSTSIINAISAGERMLSQLETVVGERDEARDYEVAAKLIDTIVAANKTIMDIHSGILKGKRGSKQQVNIGTLNANQTANVTVASTKDIISQIRQLKELDK